MLRGGGSEQINSLMDLMPGMNPLQAQFPTVLPPAEEWPDVVGSPYTYGPLTGGRGAGGMPDTVTGGTMPLEDWINANRGPKGFFSLLGDPTFRGGARLRTDLPGGRSPSAAAPRPQGVIEPGVQGVPPAFQAGAYGLSTSNPKLMAQMGYADSGQRADYLGSGNVPPWILRNGQLINVAEGNIQSHPSLIMGPSITRPLLNSGATVGYPTAFAQGPGAPAYAGWPGQMNPWVTVATGRI
jgi:hypothetical protein